MRSTISSLISPEYRRTVHRRLLRWYSIHKRRLPWRDVDNPYYVLISEFMAQQTQLARVVEHFPRWIKRFPDIAALAAAPRRAVLIAWSGMGYNRRALNLHTAAQRIVSDFEGRIPDNPDTLRVLPGIGRYTAHAVACFGYGKRVPVVDVNVRRVLSRLSRNMRSTDALLAENDVWPLAADALPPRAHYNWNQALMDLGAAICTAKKPRCTHCPLRTDCPSAQQLSGPKRATASTVRETPRRVYRGRVIELLRRVPGHCATAEHILDEVLGEDNATNRKRMLDITASLVNDEMVSVLKGRSRLTGLTSLPKSLSTLRICLVT